MFLIIIYLRTKLGNNTLVLSIMFCNTTESCVDSGSGVCIKMYSVQSAPLSGRCMTVHVCTHKTVATLEAIVVLVRHALLAITRLERVMRYNSCVLRGFRSQSSYTVIDDHEETPALRNIC